MARPDKQKHDPRRPGANRRDERRGRAAIAAYVPLPQTVPGTIWHTLIPIMLIALVTCEVFARGWNYPFVSWDDGANLQDNRYIYGFTRENIEWMFTGTLLGVWQPLSWIAAALQWVLFADPSQKQPMDQWSHVVHVANIALHAVVAILCFVVMRRLMVLGMARRGLPSANALAIGATFAGLFFAIHPLRVESVTWATAQPYILAMIACLGCVWYYLKAAEAGSERWTRYLMWHGLAVLCLILSLLCKSIAVPLVAVLLILDFYPLRRIGGDAGWSGREILWVIVEKMPYAIFTIAAIGIAVWATATEKKYLPEPFMEKTLVAAYCMMFYVAITFVPVGIAPFYWKGPVFIPSDPWWGGSLLVFMLITAVALFLWKRWPWLLAAWATYCVILLPVVGFVKHGGQMAADRYTYLSCIAWAILLGAGVTRLWQRPAWRGVALGAAVAVSGGLGFMTVRQIPVWMDSVEVWTAMVVRNPTYWMGFYNLAKPWKNDRRDLKMAAACYRKAIDLHPNYPEANIDLGNMYKVAGDFAAARKCYEAALIGKPNFHMAEYHLAMMALSEKKYDEALRRLRVADADARRFKSENHRYAMIEVELGRVLILMNRREEARIELRRAEMAAKLKRQPEYLVPIRGLLAQLGEKPK